MWVATAIILRAVDKSGRPSIRTFACLGALGEARHNVTAGNLIDRGGSGLSHNRF